MPYPFSLSDAVAASALSTGTLTALGYLLFPRCKEAIRRFMKVEIDKLGVIEEKIDKHEDEITFLRAAVLQHGNEMKQLPLIAESMRASAAASQDMARTMREIHEEVKDHSKQLAKWDGFMQGVEGKWNGIDRRGHGRRHGDVDDN